MNSGQGKVQAEYQDGGTHGSQSTWPKVLKITGIGCAILMLVGALLIGFGAFRIFSCFSDLQELEAAAQQSQDHGHRFAMALHEGDYDVAYNLVAESKQAEVSQEEFEAYFAEYHSYLVMSRPFPLQINVDEDQFELSNLSGMNKWLLGTWFAAPDREEILYLDFVTEVDEIEDGTKKVGIIHWQVELDDRVRENDRYVPTVRDFHDRITRRNFSEAQTLVSRDGQLSRVDEDEFTAQVIWLADALDSIVDEEVEGVYPRDKNTLIVRLLMTDDQGDHHLIDYTVDWRPNIVDISEIRAVELDETTEEDAVDEDDEDVGEVQDDGAEDEELEGAASEAENGVENNQ